MKQLLIYLAIVFPLTGFSQALWKTFSNPSLMKKKGVQKIRVYNRDNDTPINMKNIPYITAYFDREGRITKTIILFPEFFDDTMWWEIREDAYDTLGRITIEQTNYSLVPDADQTTFIARGSVTSYHYEGDSVLFSIDSNRFNNRIRSINTHQQTWHWEKPAPPNPRPLLWPDSICTSQAQLDTWIDFSYASDTASIPYRIDTMRNVQHISWSFQNGKLVGKDITKFYRSNELVEHESTYLYTLNLDYDTARHITTGRNFREVDGKFIYEPVKFTWDTIQTFYTKRKGENYIILTDEGRFDRYKMSIERTYKTTYPWSNEDIMPYYNEYAIFYSKTGFFPLESALKYGERIEIIYW